MDKYLGTEIDFSGNLKLSKSVTISLGYSQMFGTESLQNLRGGDRDATQNWARASVHFHPNLFTIYSKE
jgi:hypothetical protein